MSSTQVEDSIKLIENKPTWMTKNLRNTLNKKCAEAAY
jgi:hypothetical protein